MITLPIIYYSLIVIALISTLQYSLHARKISLSIRYYSRKANKVAEGVIRTNSNLIAYIVSDFVYFIWLIIGLFMADFNAPLFVILMFIVLLFITFNVYYLNMNIETYLIEIGVYNYFRIITTSIFIILILNKIRKHYAKPKRIKESTI